ncbi:MAG: phosphoglycerate kinase [Candidatus Woesearchaeota archaeon]
MIKMFSIDNFDVKDKIVLIRTDFNVPLDEQGNITDNKRIVASLPTIKELLKRGATVITMSHLGRPDGKKVKELQMDNVAKELAKELEVPVKKLDDCLGQKIKKEIQKKNYCVYVIENLRFHNEEEANDERFAKEIAELGDYYVNDAFGTCHRAHASVVAITKFLPSATGYLLEKEISNLSKALKPKKPFVVILGGAKISDKIGVIQNLKATSFLIGGAMCFTFLKALGKEVGKSKAEEDKIDFAQKMMKKKNVVLPADVVVADDKENPTKVQTVNVDSIPKDTIGLDVGDKTVSLFKKEIKKAKTIVWNGPLGLFEKKPFDKATREIANSLKKSKAEIIIGGGDTIAAIEKLGIKKDNIHISTGGGASLEFLEGKKLPAIKALEENFSKYRNKIYKLKK